MKLTNYKTYTEHYSIEINGVKHLARVGIAYMPDESDYFDRHISSENERIKLREKLDSGILEYVWIKVVAELCGETGVDTLGGCVIGEGYNIDHVVEENGMIENALLLLQSNLNSQYSALSKLFGYK